MQPRVDKGRFRETNLSIAYPPGADSVDQRWRMCVPVPVPKPGDRSRFRPWKE